MGTACTYETDNIQTEKKLATKSSINIQVKNRGEKMYFTFTNQSIKDLRSDRLVIFTDPSINLKKNDHFLKLQSQAGKLQQIAIKKRDSNTCHNKQIITITNKSITTLHHDQISLIVCDIWKEKEGQISKKFKKTFQTVIINFFEQLKQVKSIVFTQFPRYFGYSLKHNMNTLIKQLVKVEGRPSKVKFCCLNQDSAKIIQRLVGQNRNNIQKTIIQSQNASHF